MRITQLTPGTGSFYCGSCLRDNTLVRGLAALGHETQIVPLYLPLVLEDDAPAVDAAVHMGGVNLYLQQKLPLLRHTPSWIADRLDDPRVLRWAASKGDMTNASALGAMTLSMLRGEVGRQRKEVEKLIDWLSGQPRPDVLLLSNVMLAGLVRRLREVFGARVVCSLQGEAPFLDALPEPYRAQCWDVLRERVADVDAFVPVSRWYGELMGARLGLDPARVHPVHNGIEADDYAALERDPGPPTIGYLARMCADKGLPTLVEAFLLLRERVPGARLRIAGVQLASDAQLIETLDARVREAGAGAAVDVLANIGRAEKLAFLRTLDALSVPATYGESFGLYLLEAWAAGVPVVQPHHGAFPELIGATGAGLLCAPDDPAALAAALEALLLDEDRRRALGAAGRAAVLERFTVSSMATGVERVCGTVLEAAGRAQG